MYEIHINNSLCTERKDSRGWGTNNRILGNYPKLMGGGSKNRSLGNYLESKLRGESSKMNFMI